MQLLNMPNDQEKISRKEINTFLLNSCFSKRAYKTEHEAWSTSIKIAEEQHNYRPMRPYECKYCKQFHLTRSSSSKYTDPKGRIDIKMRSIQKYKNPQKKQIKPTRKATPTKPSSSKRFRKLRRKQREKSRKNEEAQHERVDTNNP